MKKNENVLNNIKSSKYNFGFKENDYKTPPVLYQKALKYFNIDKFDLDTCCTDFNIPASLYYRECGLYSDGEQYLSNNNGLTGEWFDFNWCNPPFNECKKWVEKAFIENEKWNKIAMLLPVRTEAKYWHDYILNNPNVHIEWLRKGYKFLDKDNNEMGIFNNALALVYFN